MSFLRFKYLRKRVPKGERIASAVILCLLAAVALAIGVKGQHYDPSRFRLEAKALAAPQAANASAPPNSKQTVTVTPTPAPAESGAPAQAAAAFLSSAGLEPLGQSEKYNRDTLYEKIDGKADAYLAFDFAELTCGSFNLKGRADAYVDTFSYDMGKPLNAFGIFATERDPAGKPLDFVADGYQSGVGFFLRRGRFYVQVLASAETPELIAAAQAIAKNAAESIPADDTGMDAFNLLPAAGQIAGSRRYTLRNAQGMAFLGNVYQADYDFEAKRVTFFIAPQADGAAAAAAYQAFCDAARQDGSLKGESEVGGAKLAEVQGWDTWNMMFARGDRLGGILNTDAPEAARKFIEQYLTGTGR